MMSCFFDQQLITLFYNFDNTRRSRFVRNWKAVVSFIGGLSWRSPDGGTEGTEKRLSHVTQKQRIKNEWRPASTLMGLCLEKHFALEPAAAPHRRALRKRPSRPTRARTLPTTTRRGNTAPRRSAIAVPLPLIHLLIHKFHPYIIYY